MQYTKIKKLLPVEELIQMYPLSDTGHARIMRDRQEIKAIMDGRDQRLLMIVGPCSAWPKEAVFEYAQRLLMLNEKVKSAIKIVMRLYIQKPRTTKGWTGPVNQPNFAAPSDIMAGTQYVRDMMVRVVELGLPIADECLFTHNARGFMELVSWFAIGARSSEDQEHRIFASAADCAVGMKNPTHGSMRVAVNSVVAAQHPHIAAIDQYEVQTYGNPYAHLVLRGSNQAPNYSLAHLEEAKKYLTLHQVKNPAVLIDASHDNSLVDGKKDCQMQPKVIFDVIDSIKQRPELKNLVKGFMLESFIKEGNQQIDASNLANIDLGGLSVTDPCLSFLQTEALLLKLMEKI